VLLRHFLPTPRQLKLMPLMVPLPLLSMIYLLLLAPAGSATGLKMKSPVPMRLTVVALQETPGASYYSSTRSSTRRASGNKKQSRT
jgi:hypothetical protein